MLRYGKGLVAVGIAHKVGVILRVFILVVGSELYMCQRFSMVTCRLGGIQAKHFEVLCL